MNYRFQPGETVTNERFSLFEPVLPRNGGEPDASYALRLEQKGLCYSISSEQCRDVAHFKSVLSAARRDGLPVAVITAPVPDHISDRARERLQKSPTDYLREARANPWG
jgi:hypothetical protein